MNHHRSLTARTALAFTAVILGVIASSCGQPTPTAGTGPTQAPQQDERVPAEEDNPLEPSVITNADLRKVTETAIAVPDQIQFEPPRADDRVTASLDAISEQTVEIPLRTPGVEPVVLVARARLLNEPDAGTTLVVAVRYDGVEVRPTGGDITEGEAHEGSGTFLASVLSTFDATTGAYLGTWAFSPTALK